MATSAYAVMGIHVGFAILCTVPSDMCQYHVTMFAGLHFSGTS